MCRTSKVCNGGGIQLGSGGAACCECNGQGELPGNDAEGPQTGLSMLYSAYINLEISRAELDDEQIEQARLALGGMPKDE
jgi:hypothetical protein